MASNRDVPEDPLAAAIALGPKISAAADDTERRRRVSPELLGALRDAGVFRMGLPRELGGSAVDLTEMMAVLEEIARHDGSTGWIAGIGSGTNLILTGLPSGTAQEVFASDPDIATGGTWLPRGRARQVDGGYRVSGRWPFGSGCEHCDWLIGGCVVWDGDEPAVDDQGRRVIRVMVFPREEAVIHDTWNVMGLRGTGSHDYEVADVFVPDDYAFRIGTDLPSFSFTHARMPLFGMLAVTLAAVLLGIARGAIDAFGNYARSQRAGEQLVKDLPLIQVRMAEAEALVQSARAFAFGTAERVWAEAEAGETIPRRDDLLLRLAASHAARACTDAVHIVFTAGGTAALYADSPLQRYQRDILAAQQHGMVAFYSFQGLGKSLLDEVPKNGTV
jgi:alkylation response protein AidB-like acyl-CoA dehydrogenase